MCQNANNDVCISICLYLHVCDCLLVCANMRTMTYAIACYNTQDKCADAFVCLYMHMYVLHDHLLHFIAYILI